MTQSKLFIIGLLAIFILGVIPWQMTGQTFDEPPVEEVYSDNLKPGSAFGPSGGTFIDDSRAKGAIMYVRPEIYNAFKEWMLEGKQQQVPLTEFLSSRIDPAEADQFLKDFKGGNQRYFDAEEKDGSDTCACKYLTIDPVNGPQHGYIDFTPPTEISTSEYTDGPGNSDAWLHSIRFGAARRTWMNVDGRRDWTYDPPTESNNARARVGIIYACVDNDQFPSDCGCSKSIEVDGEMSVELDADVDGDGIGDKKVKGSVEAAALFTDYTVGPTISTVDFTDVSRVLAYDEHNVTWSPEFVISLFELAKAAVNDLTGTQDSTNLITEAFELLQELATNDSLIVDVGSTSAPAQLQVDGTANMTINPLEEKIILITSLVDFYASFDVGWFSSGDAWARMINNFWLSVILPYDDDENCCLEKFGGWAYGGWDHYFNTMPEVENSLTVAHYGPWDDFDITENFGTCVSTAQACNCNVKPDIKITSARCDSVVIDIGCTMFADEYRLSVERVDENGDYLCCWNSMDFTTDIEDVINLSDPSTSPLGEQDFKDNWRYKISLTVHGHCASWVTDFVYLEPESISEAKIEVPVHTCEEVMVNISGTTGYDQIMVSVREVDEDNNQIGNDSWWTGWETELPDVFSLTDPAGPMESIPPFEADKFYRIKVAIQGSCVWWEEDFKVIEIDPTAIPNFTLDVSCDEIIFDGTSTVGEEEFMIEVFSVNIFGNPDGVFFSNVTGGMVQGEVGIYNLLDAVDLPGGMLFKVRLTVTNDCSGMQTLEKVLDYSTEPHAEFTMPSVVCEGNSVFINGSGSSGDDEFRIEVFLSTQFGQPIGPIIDFTNGFVPGPIGSVLISPTSQVVFTVQPGQFQSWYTVILYVTNPCTEEVDMVFHVIRVIPQSPDDCIVQVEDPEPAPDETAGDLGGDSAGSGGSEGGEDGGKNNASANTQPFIFTPETGNVMVINPNPARESVTINYHLADEGPFVLEIFDPFGRMMKTRTVDLSEGQIKLDLTGYASGLYLARISSEKGLLISKRMVVTK